MVFFLYSNKACEHQAISCIRSIEDKITDDMKIVYNNNDPSSPILFLIGTNQEYLTKINNDVYRTYLHSGQWIKYPLDIRRAEYYIEVTVDNKITSFTVNRLNIETYKSTAVRIQS